MWTSAGSRRDPAGELGVERGARHQWRGLRGLSPGEVEAEVGVDLAVGQQGVCGQGRPRLGVGVGGVVIGVPLWSNWWAWWCLWSRWALPAVRATL